MGAAMAGQAEHKEDRSLVVRDSDKRSERMLDDPARYFAEARRRAEREVKDEADHRRTPKTEHSPRTE